MSSTKDEWVARGGLKPQVDDLKRREIERLAATLSDESISADERARNRERLLQIHASMDDEFTSYDGDD